ncbi:Hypothetical predicted protein [Podarcis lilfordi]|nr:Hypothetical predicted protein [Podarcis lilfordi]
MGGSRRNRGGFPEKKEKVLKYCAEPLKRDLALRSSGPTVCQKQDSCKSSPCNQRPWMVESNLSQESGWSASLTGDLCSLMMYITSQRAAADVCALFIHNLQLTPHNCWHNLIAVSSLEISTSSSWDILKTTAGKGICDHFL